MGWRESCDREEEYYRCKAALDDALGKQLEALERGDKAQAEHWEAEADEAQRRADSAEHVASPTGRRAKAVKGRLFMTWVLGELASRPAKHGITTLQYRCRLISKHTRLQSKLVLTKRFIFLLIGSSESQAQPGGDVETLMNDVAETVPLLRTFVVHRGEGGHRSYFSALSCFEVVQDDGSVMDDLLASYAAIEPHADRHVADAVRRTSDTPPAECTKQVILRVGVLGLDALCSGISPKDAGQLLTSVLTLAESHLGGGRIAGVDGTSCILLYPTRHVAAALHCALSILRDAAELREKSRPGQLESCLFPCCAMHVDDILTCSVGDTTSGQWTSVSRGADFCDSLLALAGTPRVPGTILTSADVKHKVDGELGLALHYTFAEAATTKRISNKREALYSVTHGGQLGEVPVYGDAPAAAQVAYFSERRAHLSEESVDSASAAASLAGKHSGPNAAVPDKVTDMHQGDASPSMALFDSHTDTLGGGEDSSPEAVYAALSAQGPPTRRALTAYLRRREDVALFGGLGLPNVEPLLQGLCIGEEEGSVVSAEQVSAVVHRATRRQ